MKQRNKTLCETEIVKIFNKIDHDKNGHITLKGNDNFFSFFFFFKYILIFILRIPGFSFIYFIINVLMCYYMSS